MWKSLRRAPAPELRVLMVCSGNICRSPTAEGVLRARLRAAGLQDRVEVDSAGVHGFHISEPPDPRAQRHALQRGYDLSKQRARRLEAVDFDRFQYVLAMDQDNLESMCRMAPAEARGRIGLLMAHALRHRPERDVPDPYYGPPSGFERVLDLVEDACDGLLENVLRPALVGGGNFPAKA